MAMQQLDLICRQIFFDELLSMACGKQAEDQTFRSMLLELHAEIYGDVPTSVRAHIAGATMNELTAAKNELVAVAVEKLRARAIAMEATQKSSAKPKSRRTKAKS